MLGEIISHYRILEELGHGGMGSVYKALDLNLDRIVAIKFITVHLRSDSNAVKRFIREAKSASALDHQNVGTIYEIDESDDGRMFIVMACYDGETLRERMERGNIGLEEAVGYTSQIASGLAIAHEKGIVHRDIKPSNIIITKSGQVKIIDFGLAKLAGSTKLTRDYSTVGTVAYMSPEQIEGRDVDQRSDIFSLGVMFYEMLAGLNPFKAEHEAAVLYKVLHESPKPLSEYCTECPPNIQTILDKAMSKGSSKRYQDTRQMMRDLDELHEAHTDQSSTVRNTRMRPVTRGVLAVFLLCAIVASVLVLINLSNNGWLTEEEPAIAVIDFRNIDDPGDSVGKAILTSLLHVGLSEYSPIRVVSPDYIYDLHRRKFGSTGNVVSKNQVLDLARSVNSTCYLSGEIGSDKGKAVVFWRLIDTNSGNSIVSKTVQNDVISEIADEIIREIILELAGLYDSKQATGDISPVNDMTTSHPEAYRYYVAGMLAHEQFYRRDALVNLRRAIELDSTFALAYLDLSKICMGLRDYESSSRYLNNAWHYRDKLNTRDRGRLDATMSFYNDKPEEMFKIFEALLRRWPDDRAVIQDYCDVKMHWGDIESAIEIAQEGLVFYPGDQVLIHDLFSCFLKLRRCEDGVTLLKNHIKEHGGTLNDLDNIGILYLGMGLPDSAETYYLRALGSDPNFYYSKLGLGQCEYARGNIADAIRIYEEVLERKDLLVIERINILTRHSLHFGNTLAWFYSERGQIDIALTVFDAALNLASKEPQYIDIVRRRKANFLYSNGFYNEALLESSGRFKLVEARSLLALDSLDRAKDILEAMDPHAIREKSLGKLSVLQIEADLAIAQQNPSLALRKLDEMKLLGISVGGQIEIDWRKSKAKALEISGRYDEAVKELHNLSELFGSHAAAHYELGMIYEKTGKLQASKNEYEIFLERMSLADEGLKQVEDVKRRLSGISVDGSGT